MAKFHVNKGYSSGDRVVTASTFVTNGEFVDFFDADMEVVFRVRAVDVYTVERLPD